MTAFLGRLWARAKGMVAGLGIGAALGLTLALALTCNAWRRPAPGTPAAAPTVVVAGEAALTDEAEEWKKEELTCPPPLPGAPEIRIVYRDPDPAELERLARQYAATFVTATGPAEVTVEEPKRKKRKRAEPAARPFRLTFGEYSSPEAPYGATFLSGIGADGEFQAIFDLDGPPKARWTNVWGFGGRATYGEEGLGAKGFYGFWEPGQVKQVHGRLEGGIYEDATGATDFQILFAAEWRAEPWRRKAGNGLKAIKVGE